MCLKGPLRALPQLRLRHQTPLLFRALCALCGGVVPVVSCLPWDQHVALGAPWVGEVSLLQNDHNIPDMPVEKVHPHRRPRPCPAWAALHWAAL